MTTRWRSWLVGGLLLGPVTAALAEEVTLTTYYPSPRGVYGVYKELRVTDKVGIGTDPGEKARRRPSGCQALLG